VRTGRLARMGSIFSLLLAVVACSSTTTPSPTVVTSSAGLATPSPIPSPSPTASPTVSPTASPTASPRPMAPATVKAGPAMTQAREGQAAVRLADGRVLILGGIIPFVGKCPMACIEPDTSSVEVYDPKTGKFSHDGSLAEARAGAQALLLGDGTVLVEGGGYGALVETMEIFDPARGKSALVKLPANVESLPMEAAISLLADGRVLIAGGSYDDLNTASNVTLIFDPASGEFSNGPLMARPRQGATATLLDDGRVLIVGEEQSAELIDPLHPLSQSTFWVSRYPATSTLLSDGRVLVAEWGQSNGVGCTTPAVSEVFDPRTERFNSVSPMRTPRTGSAAIKIQDGRVLVFGGMDSKCVAAGTVEAFDPDSGTFQVIATGFPKISGFSATLLDDGEILIAGGGGNEWNGMTAGSWFLKP
jgi:hypothetical protein